MAEILYPRATICTKYTLLASCFYGGRASVLRYGAVGRKWTNQASELVIEGRGARAL